MRVDAKSKTPRKMHLILMEILKTLRKIDVYKHEYNSVFDLKIYHVNDNFYAFIQELIAYTSEQPKRVNYEVQVDEKI